MLSSAFQVSCVLVLLQGLYSFCLFTCTRLTQEGDDGCGGFLLGSPAKKQTAIEFLRDFDYFHGREWKLEAVEGKAGKLIIKYSDVIKLLLLWTNKCNIAINKRHLFGESTIACSMQKSDVHVIPVFNLPREEMKCPLFAQNFELVYTYYSISLYIFGKIINCEF